MIKEHEFSLVIEGDLDDDAVADQLFEAGCDDALFGTIAGVGFGDFTREDLLFSTAVLSAIQQVESVGDLRVVRVEPDDIVTMADVAERLGRTRESVRLLIAGERGSGGFPRPISHNRERGRLWRWSDVADWFGDLDSKQREAAHFTAAINAALELRRHKPSDNVTAEQVLKLAS
jgi:hypothetical protein